MAKGLVGKTLLAYVAGIVDGEGCVGLYHNGQKQYSRVVRVVVANTNEWLIRFLQMQFKGSIYVRKRTFKHPNWNDYWVWEIRSRQASAFLKLILPYLQLKRPQAELAIAYQNRHKVGGLPRTQNNKILDESDKILITKINRQGRAF